MSSGRWVEFGYAAGWRLTRALPEPVARAGFAAAAAAAYRRGGPGVRRLAANLRRVVGPQLPEPDLQELVRAGLRSYARYWVEAFRLPGRSREQLRDGFRLARSELLQEAVDAGTGGVVALPHAGNWDAAGAWAVASGWSLTAVAERLRPERLYERFVAYRQGLGIHVIPLRGGGQPPLDALAAALRDNHLVALLADRDLSARGIEVSFFGGRTRMPAGPAILALRTGAPLFVASMWYEPERPCGHLHGPLPVPPDGPFGDRVRLLTQRVADQLAAGIAAHPGDWHMLQKMWLDPAPSGRQVGSGCGSG
jgi:KDO2-lipid IV(A) lauroyltransferase